MMQSQNRGCVFANDPAVCNIDNDNSKATTGFQAGNRVFLMPRHSAPLVRYFES